MTRAGSDPTILAVFSVGVTLDNVQSPQSHQEDHQRPTDTHCGYKRRGIAKNQRNLPEDRKAVEHTRSCRGAASICRKVRGLTGARKTVSAVT